MYISIQDAPKEVYTFTEDLPEISSFAGGAYMTIHVERDKIGEGWMLMQKWRKETKVKAGNLSLQFA